MQDMQEKKGLFHSRNGMGMQYVQCTIGFCDGDCMSMRKDMDRIDCEIAELRFLGLKIKELLERIQEGMAKHVPGLEEE